MANIASTVTVVTTVAEDGPRGATVSAFMSLSLDPPMVLVALAKGSSVLAGIAGAGTFGINVLADGQADVALRFAARSGGGKFAGLPWQLVDGAPQVADISGWLACRLAGLVEGGDHTMVLGVVTVTDSAAERVPLTYHRRRFGRHVPTAEPTPSFDLWT